MRILISGGAGFVGSHTAELLALRRHKVFIVDNFSTGKTENILNAGVEFADCDITNQSDLWQVFSDFRPHAVLHLAAQSAISTAYENPQKDLQVNGIGTLNMLKFSKEFFVRRFVFSSTSAVYKEKKSLFPMSESAELGPSTPYGISKLACEQYIRTMFPNHLIFRYGNIYGPRQTPIGENQVIARAFNHFVHGEPFQVVGHGKQKRDFIYVQDVAFANLIALTTPETGIFNLASSKSFTVNDVLREIEDHYEVRGYKWEHTDENDPRGDVKMNCNFFKNTFGWRPMFSLAMGIPKTAAWWNRI